MTPLKQLSALTFTTSGTTPGFRRQLEFALPNDPAIPIQFRNNTPMCMMIVSTYNTDGAAFSGGRIIDAGGFNADAACTNYVAYTTANMSASDLNCKTSGRPTDAGLNTRQCLSTPPRLTTEAVEASLTCDDDPFGLLVDGAVETNYTKLTEASYAGPYQGGSTVNSDFIGESSARRAHYNNGTDVFTTLGGNGADIHDVWMHADTNYLYLIVGGPDALGGPQLDLSNVYLLLDRPNQISNTDVGNTTIEPVNAPGGRRVNFKGWDPDYAVEVIFINSINLWASDGAGGWAVSSTVGNTSTDTSVSPLNLYYGRDTTANRYEVAIPWGMIGGLPTVDEEILIGAYTTGDENVGGLNATNWDVYDQAPGIGQGCSGAGCHERVGDDPHDHDSIGQPPFNSDHTPYVGRTDGFDGLPNFWQPASDNYNTDGSGGLNETNDVDTIEEYFQVSVDPDHLFLHRPLYRRGL